MHGHMKVKKILHVVYRDNSTFTLFRWFQKYIARLSEMLGSTHFD
jgi:hypothetical protein